MATLEPKIIDYLQKNGPTHSTILIDYFSKILDINNTAILFRINKLVSRGKLFSDNGLISISENEEYLPEEFDEEFEYGPIKVARKGKLTFIQSNWKKNEQEKFMKMVKDSLPEIRENVKQKITTIENEIINTFDPLDVLAYISYKNLMFNPETYTESSFQGKQLFPEIVQNIILKNGHDNYKKEANRDKIPEIEKYLENLLNDLISLTGYEIGTNDLLEDIEKQILMKLLTRILVLRGDAYPRHYKLIACELFEKIKDKLSKKGFDIQQYYETIEEIERQIKYNYNGPIKKMKEEHQRFIEFCKSEEKKGIDGKNILENYQKDLETRKTKLRPDINKLSETALKGSFEIEINEKINIILLDNLALHFGSNPSWNHPLDKSEINIKPIIKVDNKYYCFIIPNLIRNVIPIIENILTDEDKIEINYSKKKGDYFENKVTELFKEKLKSANVYSKLHYAITENGEDKWPEIDCIIIHKDNLLLIEIKGKTKRDLEGRHDVLTVIEGDLKKNITEAFEQTKRAYEFINKTEKCVFEKKKGTPHLVIEKSKYKNIFLLNITSESFQTFSTDLNSLKLFRHKLLDGEIYPYIINIYDLLVLMDLIEEENFIDFLTQRITISKNYELKAEDELDLLGYYLANGSLAKTNDIKILQSPLIHGYSEDIDRWYAYLDGDVKSAVIKPIKKK